jgi:diadenosine tetraphosphate (Ap4A) HIT family hydrolase
MSPAYERLVHFFETEMRMSHIYQPVMLEILMTHGGTASARDIAAAFLAHDESQIDYYQEIVKRMPGRVLGQRGIVTRTGNDYPLADGLRDLSEAERTDLIARCRAKAEAFKEKRGAAIWEHRRPATGIIPGSVRYNTFKRAAGRCELCGVPHEERALDVDHIVPRSEGGTDDQDNLQALCWRCNQDKGAGDATDFRGIRESYTAREVGCPFCELGERRPIAENPLAALILDKFPVTEGHMLAIPRRHIGDYFDLHQPERNAIQRLLEEGRTRLRQRDATIAGFNVGINSGAAAGQTVFHCHVHLIPRRPGDVENPRGGVRCVMPGEQHYSS